MEVIQLGSLAILLKWLLLGVAILFGIILLKVWLTYTQLAELNKKVFDLISSSVWIGFLIWKGSLILFDPLVVWKSPFSLLYFTGGSKGLFIAIICSIIYYIVKSKKFSIPDLLIFQSVFLFSLLVFGVYYLLLALFSETYFIYHLLLGSFTIVLLLLNLLLQNLLQKGLVSTTILFSFVNLILSFVFYQTDDRLFIFSLEQWFFIGLIILSLFFDNGKHVRSDQSE